MVQEGEVAMSERGRQRVCVVVMEAGGEWPSFVEREGSANWAVIPQQPSETPAELALRSSRRLSALAEHGAPIDMVIIAAGAQCNDQVFAARCAVARSLIQAMGDRDGQLVFSAPSKLPEPSRHELIALAGTLANQVRGTPLGVSVRFPEAKQAAPRQAISTSANAERRREARRGVTCGLQRPGAGVTTRGALTMLRSPSGPGRRVGQKTNPRKTAEHRAGGPRGGMVLRRDGRMAQGSAARLAADTALPGRARAVLRRRRWTRAARVGCRGRAGLRVVAGGCALAQARALEQAGLLRVARSAGDLQDGRVDLPRTARAGVRARRAGRRRGACCSGGGCSGGGGRGQRPGAPAATVAQARAGRGRRDAPGRGADLRRSPRLRGAVPAAAHGARGLRRHPHRGDRGAGVWSPGGEPPRGRGAAGAQRRRSGVGGGVVRGASGAGRRPAPARRGMARTDLRGAHDAAARHRPGDGRASGRLAETRTPRRPSCDSASASRRRRAIPCGTSRWPSRPRYSRRWRRCAARTATTTS